MSCVMCPCQCTHMTHPLMRIILLFTQDGSSPKKDKVDEAVVEEEEEEEVRYVIFGERYVHVCHWTRILFPIILICAYLFI